MKLSEKLRLLRNEKGETQEDVSKNLGIGITTLRNYENDKLDRLPNTYQLKQLKDYYNVTYEYLLDEECENKSLDTINIGKELNFSDKSITKIKNLEKNSKYLNLFFEQIDLDEYISMIRKFYKINHIIKYDMFRLIQISALEQYIIDRIKNKKTDDLLDFFEDCDKSISNIVDFVYSKDNLFFSPSDSVYDLFKESYYSLSDSIFSTNQNIDEQISDFTEILNEDFIELYQEIYYKMNQFKKLILMDISEFHNFSIENIDDTNFEDIYKNILGNYIKFIKKNEI